ncbi:MAG TPA: dodecin family protein [Actinomycetota bacterium]|nr:dodecin family protein [Actinomycetota bacterium]
MPVVKTIDLVGVSTEGWRQAAQEALAEAAKSLKGIEAMEILETSCNVEDNKIKEYLTHVRIKFRLIQSK